MSAGWQGAVMHRRRAVAESDNSTDCDPDSLLHRPLLPPASLPETNFCNNCCSCKMPAKLRSKSKPRTLLRSRSEPKVESHASYREQLEMKVLDEGLTEQADTESHERMKRQVEGLMEVLRTLSSYTHCVELKSKVARRLHNSLLSLFRVKSQGAQDSEAKVFGGELSSKFSEIRQATSDGCEVPAEVGELMEEMGERQRDLAKAASNFSHILQSRTSSVSNTQLRKLEAQFDDIQANYLDAKTTADAHLRSLKASRLETLKKCLSSLCPLLEETAGEERRMAALLGGLDFDSVKTDTHQTTKRSLTSVEKIGPDGDSNQLPLCTCSQKPGK